jgi:hypothetical protein
MVFRDQAMVFRDLVMVFRDLAMEGSLLLPRGIFAGQVILH